MTTVCLCQLLFDLFDLFQSHLSFFQHNKVFIFSFLISSKSFTIFSLCYFHFNLSVNIHNIFNYDILVQLIISVRVVYLFICNNSSLKNSSVLACVSLHFIHIHVYQIGDILFSCASLIPLHFPDFPAKPC
jgi:hypothetical protein